MGIHSLVSDPIELLQLRLDRRLRDAGAPGAVVAVSEGGALLMRLALGPQDLWGLIPLEVQAWAPIYSVGKVVLAHAALRLVGEGVLTLDDAVALTGGGEASLRQLLSHTAGCADYGTDPAYQAAVLADPRQPWTLDEHLARAALRVPPREPWAYSNVGYLHVRRLIERVAGQPLGPALEALVLKPLGLRATRLLLTPEDALGLAPGHSTRFSSTGELLDVSRLHHPGWVAHGLLASTAMEAAAMIEALARGALLPPELAATVLEPIVSIPAHPRLGALRQGLGAFLSDGSTGRVVSHPGEGPGYSAAAAAFERPGGRWLGVAAIANRDVEGLGLDLVLDTAEALLTTR